MSPKWPLAEALAVVVEALGIVDLDVAPWKILTDPPLEHFGSDTSKE